MGAAPGGRAAERRSVTPNSIARARAPAIAEAVELAANPPQEKSGGAMAAATAREPESATTTRARNRVRASGATSVARGRAETMANSKPKKASTRAAIPLARPPDAGPRTAKEAMQMMRPMETLRRGPRRAVKEKDAPS